MPVNSPTCQGCRACASKGAEGNQTRADDEAEAGECLGPKSWRHGKLDDRGDDQGQNGARREHGRRLIRFE
jgi:hypothetical protein